MSAPISTAPKPLGLSKADQAERAAAAAREALAVRAVNAAQTAKASAVKLERLSRQHPGVKVLLAEHTALKATHATAQKDLARIDAAHQALAGKHFELSTEFERIATEKAALEVKFARAAEATLTQQQNLETLGARNIELGRQVAELESELVQAKADRDALLSAPKPSEGGKPKR